MDGEGESSEGRAGADARRSHTVHTCACALQLDEPREIRRGDARRQTVSGARERCRPWTRASWSSAASAS